MISPEIFFNELVDNGVSKYSGVPDSLLKYFCAYVSDNSEEGSHIITANEGSAIGLAAVPFTVAMLSLKLVVALIQAYVFTLLTTLYIGSAIHQDH